MLKKILSLLAVTSRNNHFSAIHPTTVGAVPILSDQGFTPSSTATSKTDNKMMGAVIFPTIPPEAAPPITIGFFGGTLLDRGVSSATLGSFDPILAEKFFSEANLCPSTSPVLSEVKHSYPVTSEFLQRFFTPETSAEDREKVTNLIMEEVIGVDPFIEQYVSVVLNHLAGFQIRVTQEAELIGMTGKMVCLGLYVQMERKMHIALDSETLTFSKDFGSVLRHEFRHALMHTVQGARSNFPQIDSAECYWPTTKKESKKINSFLQEGNKNVKALRTLLTREENGSVTEEEKEKLANLRRKANPKHYKYLRGERSSKKEWDFGQVVNSSYGKAKFVGSAPIQNGYHLHWEILDPLWGVIYYIDRFLPSAMDQYPADRRLSETDAYLFGGIPPEVIEILYRKYFKYTQNLVNRTIFPKQVIRSYGTSNHEFLYTNDLETEKLLTDPADFSFSRAKKMLEIIDRYMSISYKLDKCVIGLNILLKNGINEPDVHRRSSAIFYARGDYNQVVEHSEAIIGPDKSTIYEKLHPNTQLFHYGKALFFIGRYKEADDIFKYILQRDRYRGEISLDTKQEAKDYLQKILLILKTKIRVVEETSQQLPSPSMRL
jgi:hypothetical protein